MPETPIRTFTDDTTIAAHDRVGRAFQIVKYAHESAHALFHAFYVVKDQRDATRGAATDEEQDLLRSAVVTSGGGLDSSLKQLFRDCLPTLLASDKKVHAALEKFAVHLMKNIGDSPRELVTAMLSENPRGHIIERYVRRLTGSSLQSTDELFKACAALNVQPNQVGVTTDILKPIFHCRNQIVHEMDINFDEARRNRRPRSVDTMSRYTNSLPEVADKIVRAVHAKVAT